MKVSGAYMLWLEEDGDPDPIRFAGGRWLDEGVDV